jgi:hypothetical protein
MIFELRIDFSYLLKRTNSETDAATVVKLRLLPKYNLSKLLFQNERVILPKIDAKIERKNTHM